MESQRQRKIARQIQKDLGVYFQREGLSTYQGTMITVTKVNVTGDLSMARVYLSFFKTKDKEGLIEQINNNKKEIRHNLASRIRHQVKAVPELLFYIDDSLDYIDRIDELLNE